MATRRRAPKSDRQTPLIAPTAAATSGDTTAGSSTAGARSTRDQSRPAFALSSETAPGTAAGAEAPSEQPGPNGLSYALADRLVESRRNMPRRFAATSNGVSPRTFERWIQIGASSGDDPICVHLARRIFEAEGIDVRESLADLRMIRSASPQAAESYLKIMHPADYGGHVRTAPDEFEDQSRNRETQDRLLASPPPRMLAKLRQHRWLQVPAGATAEEMAAVETLIANIRMRITSANALPAQSQGSSD